MSLKETITLECPSCGKKSPFTIRKSINTAEEPAMKQAVRDKSAFLFECPSCAGTAVVNSGTLLYQQPEEHWLIQYIADDEATFDFVTQMQNGTSPLQPFVDDHYLIRLVRSLNRLIEKLLIFDEGLDDRIMEIYKVIVLMDYTKKNPDIENPELYFYKNDEGEKRIHILVDNQDLCSTIFLPDMYRQLEEQFQPRLPDINEDELQIDEQWAFRILLGETDDTE